MNSWKINDVIYEADEINPGLAVSPWSGHRQFAYDLLGFVKPQRVVELGTHYGCSFFAFLQACKNLGLSTEIVAIDCWEGDEQAGFYGDEVIDVVKRTIAEKFPEQNTRLIRKYFCDALADIEDESIDILHIDGLHTYEAVSEDYNTWLCKLKPDGIILFHDVDSELGYGTNVFWKEMQAKFPHNYMFSHSWGLGVLFPKGEKYYELFEQNNMADKVLIYEYKARYRLADRQLKDHVVMVEERDKVIKENEAFIDARDEAIRANEELIRAKDAEIAQIEEMVRERDEVIKKSEAMIRERDEVIKKSEAMIQTRDAAIKSNEAMIKERDAVIKINEEMIQARDEAIQSNEKMIQERDALIKEMEEKINGTQKDE